MIRVKETGWIINYDQIWLLWAENTWNVVAAGFSLQLEDDQPGLDDNKLNRQQPITF